MASNKKVARGTSKRRIRSYTAVKKLPIVYEPSSVPGYEESLLKSIISSKNTERTTAHSLLFNSVLSNITPGIRDLQYKNGIYAGKTLYRIYRAEKHYLWYEESVTDLISFLENAGFAGITYNIFPDRVDIRFNNRDKTYIGENIHSFEAGIISGFLGAGKKQHLVVDEVSCSNNGSESCHFTTHISTKHPHQLNGNRVFNNFSSSIKTYLNSNETMSKSGFAEEYYALSSSLFLESAYNKHINDITYYLGSEIGSTLRISRLDSGSAKRIEQLYELLGLGSLTVKSKKGLDMEVQFSTLKSKKGFVDISIAFLNGLLKDSIPKGSEINTDITKRNNSYVVHITESKV